MHIPKLKHIMIALFDYVGPKMPKAEYANYRKILKQSESIFNETASTKFTFVPTSNRIVNLYGGTKAETLSTLQSSDFVNSVLQMFKHKGYSIPEEVLPMEDKIPFWSGIGAQAIDSKALVISPRSINILNPRTIFHEMGHILDSNQKRNGYINNFFRKKDMHFPFLSKNELSIFKEDITRATEEGYFRGYPFKYWLKDKNFIFGKLKNKDIRNYYKNAAERNSKIPLTDRFELLAEMFSLKVQEFEFSPEMEAKYQQLNGPVVKEIFTKEEVNELLKLQKQIRKKTLSDYAISLIS